MLLKQSSSTNYIPLKQDKENTHSQHRDAYSSHNYVIYIGRETNYQVISVKYLFGRKVG